MVDFTQRIVLPLEKQMELVRAYVDSFTRVEYAASELEIKERTLYSYMGGQTRSLPFDILSRIAERIGYDLEGLAQEQQKISNLRAENLRKWREENPEEAKRQQLAASRKGIEVLKRKHKDDPSGITRTAREALRKKYGLDCYKIVGSMAYEALLERYGEEGFAKVSRKSWENLVEKLGEEGAKKYLWEQRFLPGLKRKYGDDWQEKVSAKGIETWKRKFPSNWKKMVSPAARRAFQEKYGINREILALYSQLYDAGLMSEEIDEEIKTKGKLVLEKSPRVMKAFLEIIENGTIDQILSGNPVGLDLIVSEMPMVFSAVVDSIIGDYLIEETRASLA